MRNEKILDFISEAGILKRIKRSGWWMVGVPNEESVAEHSFRCSVIGYLLARMEGIDPYRVVMMSLFGDMPEARITDLHKVASRYIDGRAAEKKAYLDQIDELDDDIKKELLNLREGYDKQVSPESVVARDADILECLFQAKEYEDAGHLKAGKFLKKAPDKLHTESAKRLWGSLKSWDSSSWWENISEFER